MRYHLERCFLACDRIANSLFGSDFNPLYRSGTIAVLLITVTVVTGLILVFFYRLSDPYESLLAIQNEVWFGRTLRSIHRYSSDATVIAVILHVFRMFAQGKSWGPRAFAWTTGTLLLLFVFVSGWTGYALIWDQHSHALVVSGSKMIDSLGVLSDPLTRSFNGSADQPPASFFFLNLFLHIVVPLGLIFGAWVHTSRMANATWFPKKRFAIGFVFLIIAFSAFVPAPLGPKANLLEVPHLFSADWFFSFFIPYSDQNPQMVLFAWVCSFACLASLPFWLKPKREFVPAHNDEKRCQGCVQCVIDCPYEAIKMMPREHPSPVSESIAVVINDLCVSCGLCAGSCAPMTIGVPGKKGSDHFSLAKEFVSSLHASGKVTAQMNIIIGCMNQPGALGRFREGIENDGISAVVFPTECMGTLHMGVVEYLAQHFKHLYLAACPERNCSNKDAHFLLQERVSGRREPHLLGRVSRDRIILVPTGDGEEGRLLQTLKNESDLRSVPKWKNYSSLLLGFVFLFLISLVSTKVMEVGSGEGVLRLSLRLSGQSAKVCRDRTSDEMNNLPLHMKTPQVCDVRQVPYRLKIVRDSEVWLDEVVQAGGARGDRPLYVDRDFKLQEGGSVLEVIFEPIESSANLVRYYIKSPVQIRRGKVSLIYSSSGQDQLALKEML